MSKRINLFPTSRRDWTMYLAVLFMLQVVMVANADESVAITRVEVDWQLIVPALDESGTSPLATCAMSPVQGDGGDFMTFEVNHTSQPIYAKGGVHLHVWNGDSHSGSVHAQIDECIVQSDVVSWTQSMSLSDGMLTYEVTNGSSSRWGEFGTGELIASVPTTLDRLNDGNVSTFFAATRISSLVIKKVRMYSADGLQSESVLNQDLLSESSE